MLDPAQGQASTAPGASGSGTLDADPDLRCFLDGKFNRAGIWPRYADHDAHVAHFKERAEAAGLPADEYAHQLVMEMYPR